MEEYNQLGENNGPRGNFLYGGGGGPVLAPNSSVYGRTTPINNFHNIQSNECYEQTHHPIVKTEAATAAASSSQHKFHYPSIFRNQDHHHHQHQHQTAVQESQVEDIKAKIIAHPQYSNLLEAYMECQKVIFLKCVHLIRSGIIF